MAGGGQARRRGAAAWAEALARGRAISSPARAPLDWQGWLRRCLDHEIEHRRLFPWIAVAFGAGILLAFAAEGQPSLWAPLGVGLAAGIAAFRWRARPVPLAVAIGLTAIFLGFAASVIRFWIVAAPVLERPMIVPLTGFIESIDEREEGARIVVLVHSLGSLAAGQRPNRVRVTVKKANGLRPAAFVAAQARLLPPPQPARPGGYDFARDAYFRGLGAVGSLVGSIEIRAPPAPPPFSLRVAAQIDDARNAFTRRIAGAIGGQAGAVAAALVTGKRGLIDEDTNAILRAAGIYHVVSISGLHMVLAAGVVFWIVRALLALSPAAALYWPVKKIAAATAMLGVTAYCVFSGWDIAAERSWVMTLVMLGAILVDRPALSMRNLAFAALICLAREPDGLLGPSFQMSFGAVAALIAFSNWIGGHGWNQDGMGPVQRAIYWALAAAIGTLGTTLIATLATAPFGTYHFQNINPYGLIGNALTLPLVSLAVMPAAVIGMLLYPLGLDQPIWWVMGLAVRGMLLVSDWISGFDHSTIIVPAFGSGALALLVVALLVLTLLISPLRWFGLAPAAIGLGLAATPVRHDIYIDREGAGAAVRNRDNRLVVIGRAPAFVVGQWLKADGDAREADEASVKAGARCDTLACVTDAPYAHTVSLVADRRAFAEDCERAVIVISRLRAPWTCRAPLVIDRDFLDRHGATAIRLTDQGREIATARQAGETRPWIPRPRAVVAVRAPPPDKARRERPTRGRRPAEDDPDPSSDESD